MFMGVPLVPLLVVSGATVLIASWTTLLVNLLLVPLVIVMGQVTRTDDQQYRLLALWLYCRVVRLNTTYRFWQASTYAPVQHQRR